MAPIGARRPPARARRDACCFHQGTEPTASSADYRSPTIGGVPDRSRVAAGMERARHSRREPEPRSLRGESRTARPADPMTAVADGPGCGSVPSNVRLPTNRIGVASARANRPEAACGRRSGAAATGVDPRSVIAFAQRQASAMAPADDCSCPCRSTEVATALATSPRLRSLAAPRDGRVARAQRTTSYD